MTRFTIAMAVAAATLGAAALAAPASAASTPGNAMKVCGAKYQAAKKAGTLPAGQTWNQFLAECRGGAAKPVAARPAPAAKQVAAVRRPAGQPSAAQQAMYAREKKCGQMWKADSAAHRIPAGQKWPQYWSACNKRIK
jgi:hypothetical protein